MNIVVNGTNYASWDQLPIAVQKQLAATLPDADRDGIPDLIQGFDLPALYAAASAAGAQPGQPITTTSITVNGQTVDSMAALPPEVQQLMRQAFGWPAAPTPSTPAPAPGAPPAGQVLLNGVPTTTDAAVAGAKKSWWRRLFS